MVKRIKDFKINSKLPQQQRLVWFLLILIFGAMARSYHINDHWKKNDHYNFAGAATGIALNCMMTTPLSESRGVYLSFCDTDEPYYYPNHPPTFLFGMWGLVKVFGHHEWVERLHTLIYSVANIILVFLIANLIWPTGLAALWAAFFQAFFHGPIYFGTHTDPISEFTLTFMLLSTYAVLKGKWKLSVVWALISGLTAWVGFLHFAPLSIYSWVKKQGRTTMLVGLILGFLLGLSMMMYLHNRLDIFHFLYEKLTHPGYVRPTSSYDKYLFPILFVWDFFQSHNRLLGPLFVALAYYELFWGQARGVFTPKKLKQSTYLQALLLTGGGGLVYALIGPEYVMVHVYLYIFMMPFFALLCAHLVKTFLEEKESPIRFYTFMLLAIFFAATYPYGIFKSNVVHDAINSGLFVVSALLFAFTHKKSKSLAITAILLTALTNVSQMMNIRNESDTEFEACEQAKKIIEETGKPLEMQYSLTKDFLYCRGLNIIWKKD